MSARMGCGTGAVSRLRRAVRTVLDVMVILAIYLGLIEPPDGV